MDLKGVRVCTDEEQDEDGPPRTDSLSFFHTHTHTQQTDLNALDATSFGSDIHNNNQCECQKVVYSNIMCGRAHTCPCCQVLLAKSTRHSG